jgi:hypothetical protein
MAQYAYQQITLGGAAITPVTPTTSDTVAPDERGHLSYENTNGAGRTVTILTPAGLDLATAILPPLTYTLAATTGRLRVGPLPAVLADPTTGLVTVNIDATAGVTVAALRN